MVKQIQMNGMKGKSKVTLQVSFSKHFPKWINKISINVIVGPHSWK